MATTQFELVTPSRTLYSGEAEMIVCRSVEGEIAFLADHMPYIGALDPCVVHIEGGEGSGPDLIAVHGGYVEVKDNQVIMLADIAELPSEVNVEAARQDQGDAESRVSGAAEGPERTEAEIELGWANVRLEVASS